MSLLSDGEIREWCTHPNKMIDPFVDSQMSQGTISFGVSSAGYDIRIGNKFKVFDSWSIMHDKVIDPKSKGWHDGFSERIVNDWILIPPNSFALGESVETFNIPRHIMGICLGKSSYCRCGIVVPLTPLEPCWTGKLTIEMSNTTPLPAKVYVGEGICQILFLKTGRACEVSYADRRGKYQGQSGLTMPFVKEKEVKEENKEKVAGVASKNFPEI